MSRRSLEDGELDQEIDEDQFLEDSPVYCPVPWCNAFRMRFVRCGDDSGDYEGIHRGRIRYVEVDARRVARELRFLRDARIEDPELMLGILRMRQDSIDSGVAPGKAGRRRLLP